MINVNIRVFAEKMNHIFGDYTEHVKLIETQEDPDIRADVNDRGDCLEIYQYYSACPLFLMEAKMLRRLGVGVSVCCIRKSLTEAMNGSKLPRWCRKLYKAYLKRFISDMDCVVVADDKIREELQNDGICEPEYFYIPESGVFADPVKYCIWKEIYKHLMRKLPDYAENPLQGESLVNL